jgi:plastocyanin
MKIKLIVSLLALCLTLSIVSVQAQTNVLGDMDDINVIMTGNITETITCNITGNAVMVEETDNVTDDMNNVTDDMDNVTDDMNNVTDDMNNVTDDMDNVTDDMNNVTDDTNNITENMTLDVTGKIILIRDLGNMTEKAVMVGSADDILGNVVIFGRSENITMDNATENMSDVTENMIILKTGNMTGTITFNTAEEMDNATGMDNMTEGMDNMTVLMTGNMTGTVTGDMTRKMVVIRNIDDINEVAEALSNMTEMDEDMDNMTEPMECDLTGKMVVIRNMDDMVEMDDEDIDDLITMDGNTAIIETMDNITGTDEGMDEGMGNVTGKIVMIRSIDDMIRIVTKTVTCDTTQSTVIIEGIDDMVEDMDNMTEDADNMTDGNVTDGNVTDGNVTDGNVTDGNMTDGNVTDENVTGETFEVSIDNFAFDPASVTISTGDTVRWTNMDSADHTATGSTFDSGVLEEGDSYEFMFTETGTFEYYCSIHPEMEGTVTVTAGNMTDDTNEDDMNEDDNTDNDM